MQFSAKFRVSHGRVIPSEAPFSGAEGPAFVFRPASAADAQATRASSPAHVRPPTAVSSQAKRFSAEPRDLLLSFVLRQPPMHKQRLRPRPHFPRSHFPRSPSTIHNPRLTPSLLHSFTLSLLHSSASSPAPLLFCSWSLGPLFPVFYPTPLCRRPHPPICVL